MRAPLGVLVAVLAACAMWSATARAREFDTVMQDDALVLHRPTPVVKRALERMRWLGVTRLRVTAVWQEIAPAGMARRKPRHFHANRPGSYPKGSWANLDRAVRLAHAARLKVMIDIGFFAPLWAAHPRRGETHGIRDVSPREFGLFAAVVTFALTPLSARLATRLGAVDQPRGRGLSERPTPLLGGLAIFAGAGGASGPATSPPRRTSTGRWSTRPIP